jgi:crotonobetainyl-CoA:carnitine CoA-transferase CaiB-like acyl-CoA transferase
VPADPVHADDALPALWRLLDGDPALLDRVTTTGPRHVLPSVFDVTGLAAAAVAAATLAVAELAAVRRGEPGQVAEVAVDRRAAAAAFRSEALLAPQGWELPPVWDAIAGDYRAADGWIRLHTNYAYHRAAALRALGMPADGADRDVVTAAVATLPAAELEERVVAEGGAAAVMHTPGEWAAHPHGRVALAEPAVAAAVEGEVDVPAALRADPAGDAARPLAGVRVLDLTRVIAGPVATRTLAAWGADVLRVDPPGFAEVPAVLPDVTAGKRRVTLDLRDDAGRAAFERLVEGAHVVVHGLRPGALAGLGLPAARLRELNPGLVRATVDAYGWHGPWSERRGFDSLVQMSSGIAAAGAAGTGADGPVPLPAQALDHGAGYLLAAGVVRALTRLVETGMPGTVWASLVGVAGVLMPRGVPDGLAAPAPAWTDADTVPVETAWGPARAVPFPATIAGVRGSWTIPAGPLGTDAPEW